MLLFVIIIFVILGASLYIRRSFVAPTFLMIMSYAIASLSILMNSENWHIHMNSNFYLYVILFIFCWLIASLIVRYPLKRLELKAHSWPILVKNAYPQKIFVIFSIVLFVIYLYMLFNRFRFDSLTNFLKSIYISDDYKYQFHFIKHQIEIFSEGLIFVIIFSLIREKFGYPNRRRKIASYIVLIILLSLTIILLTTDRNKIIRLILYCWCEYLLFYQFYSKKSIHAANKKIFKYSLLLVLVFACAFYGLGNLKGYTSNFERMIGIYTGSGLYNFNLFLGSFDGNYEYGAQTFHPFLSSLSAIFPIPTDLLTLKNNYDFIIFGNDSYVYASNIYAAITYYYADFGVWGIIVFSFLLGGFYEVLYQTAKKYKGGLVWVLYGFFIYPIFYLAIVEQFFFRFHLGLLYELFWLLLFYSIFNKRKKHLFVLR